MSHPLDHPHPFVHEFQHRTGKTLKEREGAILAELVDKATKEARRMGQIDNDGELFDWNS